MAHCSMFLCRCYLAVDALIFCWCIFAICSFLFIRYLFIHIVNEIPLPQSSSSSYRSIVCIMQSLWIRAMQYDKKREDNEKTENIPLFQTAILINNSTMECFMRPLLTEPYSLFVSFYYYHHNHHQFCNICWYTAHNLSSDTNPS